MVAAPVIPESTRDILARHADEVVTVLVPINFYGVGQWYEDFSQTGDDEVRELLEQARHRVTPASV